MKRIVERIKSLFNAWESLRKLLSKSHQTFSLETDEAWNSGEEKWTIYKTNITPKQLSKDFLQVLMSIWKLNKAIVRNIKCSATLETVNKVIWIKTVSGWEYDDKISNSDNSWRKKFKG